MIIENEAQNEAQNREGKGTVSEAMACERVQKKGDATVSEAVAKGLAAVSLAGPPRGKSGPKTFTHR